MQKNQLVRWAVVGAIATAMIGVYLFGKTTKQARNAADMPLTTDEVPEITEESYLAELRLSLGSNDTLELIDAATKSGDYLKAAAYYDSLSQPVASAVLRGKQAIRQNNDTALLHAGDHFYDLLPYIKDKSIRLFVAGRALALYTKAGALDTTAPGPKVKMAATYMDGLEQPMQGVMLLLDVIKKDSNQLDANLLLGKYGIISGQYGKAIARLEKVVSLQPENSEALFMLGEAYLNSGNRDKAIRCFEQSKKYVGTEELKEAIDRYIREVRKSSGSINKKTS